MNESNKEDILEILGQMGIPVAGSLIKNESTEKDFSIFVEVARDKENRQQPSNKKLGEAREAISELGFSISFLLTDQHARDIEAGLRATLLHSFGAHLRNVFVSVDRSIANVWFEPKNNLNESLVRKIKEKTTIYLQEFNLEPGVIGSTVGENLPSLLACMKIIRQLAPINEVTLRKKLLERNFTVPSEDWVKRKLDLLRKAGQVVRLYDGRYALSLGGIRGMGTVKGRNSPDITRLLALPKKKQ